MWRDSEGIRLSRRVDKGRILASPDNFVLHSNNLRLHPTVRVRNVISNEFIKKEWMRKTYVILSSENAVTLAIQKTFPANDYILAMPNVWLVRSERFAADVMKDLDLRVGGNSGLIVAVAHYNGIADRAVVEKLSAWEREP